MLLLLLLLIITSAIFYTPTAKAEHVDEWHRRFHLRDSAKTGFNIIKRLRLKDCQCSSNRFSFRYQFDSRT